MWQGHVSHDKAEQGDQAVRHASVHQEVQPREQVLGNEYTASSHATPSCMPSGNTFLKRAGMQPVSKRGRGRSGSGSGASRRRFPCLLRI